MRIGAAEAISAGADRLTRGSGIARCTRGCCITAGSGGATNDTDEYFFGKIEGPAVKVMLNSNRIIIPECHSPRRSHPASVLT